MNKIFTSILVLSCATAFTACVSEQPDLFDKSAPERLEEIKGVYAQRLTASDGNWVMEYYPTNEQEGAQGHGYLLLCQFTPDYKVKVAMNNDVTNNFYKESTSAWEIITDNGPVLTFNTYNDVLHTFSAPDNIPDTEENKEDETGKGYEGDYEFVITDLDADAQHAMLKGKKRGTYNRLSRVSGGTDFRTYLEDVEKFRKSKFPVGGNDLRLKVGSQLFYVASMPSGLPNVYPSDGDVVVNKDLRPYLVTKQGDKFHLRFRNNFTVGEDVEQEFVYNETSDEFEGVNNSANVLRGISDDELPAYLNSVGGTVMKFGLTNYTDASASYQQIANTFSEGMKNKSYTLQNAALTIISDGTAVDLIISYKSGRSTKSVTYRAAFGADGKNITIGSWADLGNADAKKLLNDVPELNSLLNALSATYTLKVIGSRFNISEIRFNKVDSSDFWFSSICK